MTPVLRIVHRLGGLMNKLKFIGALSAFALIAAAEAGEAQTRIQKRFDQWQVDCNEAEKAKQCGIVFALVNSQNKEQLIFAWSIVPATEGEGHKAVIRTQTGTLLPEGISVQFGGSEPVRIQYKFCGPRFCFAEVGFSSSWEKAFLTHPSFTVSYKAATGTPLKHEVGLKQFSEAFAYYSEELNRPPE